MPDFTPEQRAARTAEGLARMSADPESTKRRTSSTPAGHSALNRLCRPLSPETAKHYRQRRDGAIVRATPKPETRKAKRAKLIHEPKAPRLTSEDRGRRAEAREKVRQEMQARG